jgi:hypothetical protein
MAPLGAAQHTQWQAWGLHQSFAGPPQERLHPLGGQHSTRSGKRGGHIYPSDFFSQSVNADTSQRSMAPVRQHR